MCSQEVLRNRLRYYYFAKRARRRLSWAATIEAFGDIDHQVVLYDVWLLSGDGYRKDQVTHHLNIFGVDALGFWTYPVGTCVQFKAKPKHYWRADGSRDYGLGDVYRVRRYE